MNRWHRDANLLPVLLFDEPVVVAEQCLIERRLFRGIFLLSHPSEEVLEGGSVGGGYEFSVHPREVAYNIGYLTEALFAKEEPLGMALPPLCQPLLSPLLSLAHRQALTSIAA